MARKPQVRALREQLAPPPPPFTLEQFAALEAWVEALFRMILKEQSAGPGRAERVTAAYSSRQRAMFLLTGKVPPTDDEEAFRESVEQFSAEARAAMLEPANKAKKPIKPPTSVSDAGDDYSDIA